RPRGRVLTDRAAPEIIRPPLELAMLALAPRSAPTRCSPGQYLALLDHYRRYAGATALRAISQDWDSGRLAFSTHDRPPFEAEVLGIVGRRSGLAPARVVEAGEALEEATGALQGARAALAGRLSPLDTLCAEHGISKTGEIVLLFVAAPALWGELARLYGILSNDSARATCDEHLLWQLLGHALSRREVARELDPDSPLVHHGLIRANDRGRPFQALVPDPIVVKLLAGSTVDEDFEHGVTRVPASVALDDLMLPAKVIDRAFADLAAAPIGMGRLVVTGRSGSGRRTLLATLAQLAGRTLATIDGAMLIREKRLADLAGMLQHANMRGWLPCVDGLDTIASDDASSRGTVRELLRDHVGPLAVRLARHVPPPLEPGYVLVELPTSTIAERAGQWTTILASVNMTIRDVDELSARFTVGAGTIRRVATSVARGSPADPDAAIEAALRQYLETKLGAVATRVTRLATWSQIVLPADIHDSIVELVARIRHRRTVYDTWGFDQVMSTSRGLTALFQGGPGTGKTLVASAIANELGLDLYRIDLSRVMSKWIGETEQNLGKVFDAAEEGQALILFDEADSLFSKRTEVRTSVDRYANLEVNYLLQRLDTFEGVAVLTTNFGTAIDAAFKRRLSCRLTFPFPDDEARERLWRVHLPDQLPLAGKLDLGDLARRYKMSGGYIRNAALRAAFLAAEEQAPLSQDHLERAVRAEFREGGKLAESGFLE
ncbi:MAG TPA: ATP-binding protein, partial [Kofleriaceae bacterium]